MASVWDCYGRTHPEDEYLLAQAGIPRISSKYLRQNSEAFLKRLEEQGLAKRMADSKALVGLVDANSLIHKIQIHDFTNSQFIGKLTADLVIKAAKAQHFGVILRDIEPIDPTTFLRTALKKGKDQNLSLRNAIPDPDLNYHYYKIKGLFIKNILTKRSEGT